MQSALAVEILPVPFVSTRTTAIERLQSKCVECDIDSTHSCPVSIQTQGTQAPANRNGRSKQPIIEAANQTLALLAVFVYATHATQSMHCVRCVRCVRCVWMETGLITLPDHLSHLCTVSPNAFVFQHE